MIDPCKIPEEEKTPLVTELLHTVQQMAQRIDQLREEIARLKEHKGKPKIPPSRLEKDPKEKRKNKKKGEKRPGSKKRNKTKDLPIHETIPVPPKDLPAGSTRVGHDDWIVQGLEIKVHNVCYQLETWIPQFAPSRILPPWPGVFGLLRPPATPVG